MRLKIARLTITLLILLCGGIGAADASGQTLARTYDDLRVERVGAVLDGDTFRVTIPHWPEIIGRNIPVRVRGVDTPEIYGKCWAERVLAKRARAMTSRLLRSAKDIQQGHIH